MVATALDVGVNMNLMNLFELDILNYKLKISVDGANKTEYFSVVEKLYLVFEN